MVRQCRECEGLTEVVCYVDSANALLFVRECGDCSWSEDLEPYERPLEVPEGSALAAVV